MNAYVPKNSCFYMIDKVVEEARKHSGWVSFHRECGREGLYFNDIDKDGRKSYTAVAVRVEKDRRGFIIPYLVSRGKGKTPIDAVLDAFNGAVAAGFKVSPLHKQYFSETTDSEFEDILG